MSESQGGRSQEGWSNERIVEQYRAEIRAAFEAENRAWHDEEAADREKCEREDPVGWRRLVESGAAAPRDSFLWEIYAGSEIRTDLNSVSVLLPTGFAIGVDLIEMFERSSVTWTKADVGAEIVDGEARVVVELLLVDYWDDERAAEWEQRQRSPLDDVLEKLEAKETTNPVERVEISPETIEALSRDDS